jgi:hypothetical protein
MQAGFDSGAADRVSPVVRDPPIRPLELYLAWLEDVPNERARSRLELELLVA